MKIDLNLIDNFYQDKLGKLVCHFISKEINKIWPQTANDDILGLSYSIPFLEKTLGYRIVEMAEAPLANNTYPNRVFIGDLNCIPFQDNSFDKILAIHCLENSINIDETINELWRVLKPEGSLILIVPNRRGVWSRIDNNPFGFGVPFSRRQIRKILTDNMFNIRSIKRSIFFPPLNASGVFIFAKLIESFGSKIWPSLGGVLFIEASKRIYIEPNTKSFKPVKIRKLVNAHNLGNHAQKNNNT